MKHKRWSVSGRRSGFTPRWLAESWRKAAPAFFGVHTLGKSPGFSLVEVVIAIGIFAVAVSAMLGLLPALTRQSAASSDTLKALRLPDALAAELQRVATAGGFDALAGQTKPLNAVVPETFQLAATRDASRVHALSYQPPSAADLIESDSQYFLIEAWSFADAPLAYEAGGAGLALHVRVSWPYRLPGALAPTPLVDRDQISFNLGLNR